jgi:pyrimidine and pyridine-specific 5'-nucleotidase
VLIFFSDKYFRTHLELSAEDAYKLHIKYYQEYGLAIQGLVANHQVDALDFNAKVDDALPLEDILKPDPQLRKLLEDIDTSKVKLWLLTNAYVNHGRRVVRLLGVDDLFEGISFCDYAAQTFLAKPERAMFEKAMREAGVDNVEDCFFVGQCLHLEIEIPTNCEKTTLISMHKELKNSAGLLHI